MIIQCEQCQTRFRLADEKLKPTGTKVRCSKCKHVFTVMPPEPEPPEEEAVDFDAMNMQAVEMPPSPESPKPQGEESAAQDTAPDADKALPAGSEKTDSELDFSGLHEEMAASSTSDEERAEDFSFAGSEPEDEPAETDFAGDATGEAPGDTGASSREDSETFDFGEFPEQEQATAESTRAESEDFSFDVVDEQMASEKTPPVDETTAAEDFSFGDTADDGEAFQFDMPESDPADSAEKEFGMGTEAAAEFSFDEEPSLDEEPSFETEGTDQWGEETSADEDSFDFNEPDFGSADVESEADEETFAFGEPDQDGDQTDAESARDNLQFGEIDLQTDDDTADGQPLETDTDFTGAGLSAESTIEEEAEAFAQEERDLPKSRRRAEDKPLAAPPVKRKGPFSKVLLLLFLLLLGLGGAAGYFYLQDGNLNFARIIERFTGQAKPAAAENKININITDTGYINNTHAGQLLVVQGQAANNYPSARSAITVKGILLDGKGEPLYQQTVFCGNPLNETTLRQAPYAKIEEAMNNQFGDSLSNMDVAPGATIPFTIVFRNLPENIANINVEVVGSKPGSS